MRLTIVIGDQRMLVAREVESAVEKALVRAGWLRQAVLKPAFEGKLVNGRGFRLVGIISCKGYKS